MVAARDATSRRRRRRRVPGARAAAGSPVNPCRGSRLPARASRRRASAALIRSRARRNSAVFRYPSSTARGRPDRHGPRHRARGVPVPRTVGRRAGPGRRGPHAGGGARSPGALPPAGGPRRCPPSRRRPRPVSGSGPRRRPPRAADTPRPARAPPPCRRNPTRPGSPSNAASSTAVEPTSRSNGQGLVHTAVYRPPGHRPAPDCAMRPGPSPGKAMKSLTVSMNSDY